MGFVHYLAMTREEFSACDALPAHPGWMACHFSAYGTGLQDLPENLPDGALLILDDRIPVCGHDPRHIIKMLGQVPCGSLLLDFQRPGCPETAQIAQAIVDAFPQAALSEPYAHGLSCPVFLPPVPLLTPLKAHIAPWQDREIWLDTALEQLEFTLTPQGFACSPCDADTALPFCDKTLHCHYRTEVFEDHAKFILRRGHEDITSLLKEAEALGITAAVGLYQQFKD